MAIIRSILQGHHAKEEIREELRWAKEILAKHEQDISIHDVGIPDQYERLLYMNPQVLKEHIQRLEHDLQDIKQNRVQAEGFDEIEWSDEQDEDDEIDGFIDVEQQIEIEREFHDEIECSEESADVLVPADEVLDRNRQKRMFEEGGDDEIDGLIDVKQQISTIRRNHEQYMAEPDFELGDRFRDDHTGQILVVKHRMQNYDDPEDFLYALELDDADIPNYQWHGEDWIHSHYERISDEEAGDEE